MLEALFAVWLVTGPVAPVAPHTPPPLDPNAPHVAAPAVAVPAPPDVAKGSTSPPAKGGEKGTALPGKAPAAAAGGRAEPAGAAPDLEANAGTAVKPPEAKKPRRPARSRKSAESTEREDPVQDNVPYHGDSVPPTLAAKALRGELQRGSGEGEGKGEAKSERARLEELAAEIQRAREALRQDTARLEAMLAQKKPAGAGGGAAGGGQPATTGSGGDFKMPVGDPMRPNATATTPPADARELKGQVELVSKAMKGIKPEQAAPIIARLERVLAAEILRRMPPADAGAVLAQLKPEVAADLATEVATKPPLGPLKETK